LRVLLTGGGTGGHVYPALAIAEALSEDSALLPLEILFVGTRDGLESEIVPASGIASAYVEAAPLPRTVSLALFRTLYTNAVGFVQSLGVLHRFKPDVAIATGGYVTFPVIAALRTVTALGLSQAKIALLEPNAEPGLTNRLLGPLVDEIWMTLTPSGAPKTITTGTPVRATFARELDQSAARVALGLDPAFTTIVVFGGSQGARSLNEAFAALARELPPQRQMLLVTGSRDHADIAARLKGAARVRVVRYLDDPRAAYAAADLVVARAGASTLAELSATATPALLVPYPHATGDHQARNAEVFARGGGARVLADRDLSPGRLRAELDAALEPGALAALRTGARLSSKGDARAHVVARVKALLRPNYVRP
jgi:UDP-N-acetylglucosamine--N-acetylmuramyl-(pentapeptide) pyrophosphoryl-undecaprenol N-acetylglucosamine transferase